MATDTHTHQCRVKALYRQAVSLRVPHENGLKDCYKYTFPSRSFDLADRDNGTPDRSFLYDSTAVDSVQNLMTTTMRLLVPQNVAWAKVIFVNPAAAKSLTGQSREVQQYLATVNEILFDHFQNSNFYLAASEALSDNITGGTAAVAIIDQTGAPLSYLAVPVNEIYVIEDAYGVIDIVFRKHSLTARQIAQRVTDTQLPDDLVDEIEENASTRHIIIEAVVPDGVKFTYGLYRESDWLTLTEETSPMTPFVAWR
jgi:hypothetical protein